MLQISAYDLQAFPLAKLDLALGNLLRSEQKVALRIFTMSRTSESYFLKLLALVIRNLVAFWLIKTVQNLNKGELSEAIRYYYLYSEVDAPNFISTLVQILLFDRIDKELEI